MKLTIEDSLNPQKSMSFATNQVYVTKRKDTEPQSVRPWFFPSSFLVTFLSNLVDCSTRRPTLRTPMIPDTLSLSSASSSTAKASSRRTSFFDETFERGASVSLFS